MSLTGAGCKLHNWNVALCHRPVHGLLLVVAFAANLALAPCGGWQSSAQARMACCVGADHACSQARADDCCAAGEERQHGETAGGPIQALTAPPAVVALPIIASVTPIWEARAFRPDVPRGSPPDTHILLSVFLI